MYLGIDLGTSNSAVVSYLDGSWRVLKTVDKGTDVLPSAIYIDGRKNKFYGHRAYEHLFKNPDNAVSGFKRQMGTSWKKEFAKSGEVMTAEECSADILRQLVAQARVEHGEQEFAGVVITTPAAFNQMQIEGTLRAAQMAGLEKVALLQEPVAAALAVVAEKSNKDGTFLVYDIGGGTFDLALVQSVKGKVSVIAHDGINALGGRDFDRILINNIVRPWLLENFSLPEDFQKQKKYAKMMGIMRMAAEQAKINLSAEEETKIHLSDDELGITDEEGNDIYLEIPVNRKDYERLIADKLDETVEKSRGILKNHGYKEEDIDQLIFIGGPSKTPRIRDLIPQQLGIAASIDTDPMTAVAIGAAIFCEGVDWQSENMARKKSRERAQSGGNVEIQYDYESRTASNGARLRIKPQGDVASGGYEIQIDSTEGWSSGRKALDGDIAMELPLDNKGENRFRAMVFASNGELVKDAVAEIVITRASAVADSLKLTHNLSAVVRRGDGEEAENALHIFAEKGTTLPAEGEADEFRAAKDLRDEEDTLRVDFYQQPNKENFAPNEPNLHIGAVDVRRDKLEDDIQRGDDLSILWAVDESGHVSVKVKLDKTGEIFGGKFYSPELGHRSYEGRDGDRLMADMLQSAKKEMKAAENLSETATADLQKHKKDLKLQEAEARNAADGEERRSICEKIRDIRQEIARYCNDPKNRQKAMKAELAKVVKDFDENYRKGADEDTCEKFDSLKRQARGELKEEDGDYEVAKRCIEEMKSISSGQAMSDPQFWLGAFVYFSERRATAISVLKHDDLVEQGKEAIENKDMESLTGIVRALAENQAGGGSSIADFSDIMSR